MKIRLLELCAGYGSQALALKNLGIDVYSEIAEFDKYASQAYMQLHGETKNYGDIYTIDETKLPYFDMITYSTPCQDFSVAGKGKGGDKGSGTRSSLLWECERIIRAVKPKYLLMENVKNLLSEKHRHNFNEWFKVLEGMGYTNYYKVLNAKDYGIPQNRERIFCVSILGGGQYLFPNPIPLDKRLKDMLDDNVDEKYYLSDEQVKRFLRMGNVNPSGKGMNGNVCTGDICNTLTTNKGEGLKIKEVSNTIRCGGGGSLDGKHTWDIVVGPQVLTPKRTEYGKQIRKDYEARLISESRHNMTSMEPRKDGISNTLTSVQKDNYVVEPKAIQVGQIYPDSGNPQAGRIYDNNGISPAIDTCQGGNRMTKIIQNSHGFNKGGVFENSPTITSGGKYQDNNFVLENYRIRKLTPRECWRLMGVKDEQFDRLHGISNSQLYKLAGNSIVVDVLEAIFKNLLMPETTDTKGQLTLF